MAGSKPCTVAADGLLTMLAKALVTSARAVGAAGSPVVVDADAAAAVGTRFVIAKVQARAADHRERQP